MSKRRGSVNLAAPAVEAAPSPAAPIVLKIVKPGAKWKGDLIVQVAQNVGGLDFGPTNRLELPGKLRTEPIAVLTYATGPAQAGEGVSCLQITVDPETCCLGWMTFERALESAQKMAGALDASLVGEDGQQLTPEAIKAAEERLAPVRKEREAQRVVIEPQPDGTLKKRGPLSFVSETRTKRGRCASWSEFDVAALPYYEGQAKGLECMRELLDAIRARNTTQDLLIDRVLESAFATRQACDFNQRVNKPHAANVADGFLSIVTHAVVFFARHSRYERFIEAMRAEHLREAERLAEEKRREAEEFVARMKAGRSRKAAGRARRKPVAGSSRGERSE